MLSSLLYLIKCNSIGYYFNTDVCLKKENKSMAKYVDGFLLVVPKGKEE